MTAEIVQGIAIGFGFVLLVALGVSPLLGREAERQRDLDTARQWAGDRYFRDRGWYVPPVPLRTPWWVRTRPDARGVSLGTRTDGCEPRRNVYVPWWGKPAAWLHRWVYGPPRFVSIELPGSIVPTLERTDA